MTTELTTVSVKPETSERLDDLAESMYGDRSVAKRVVVQNLCDYFERNNDQ